MVARLEIFGMTLLWSLVIGTGIGVLFGTLLVPVIGTFYGGAAGLSQGVVAGLIESIALAFAAPSRSHAAALWKYGAIVGAVIGALTAGLIIRAGGTDSSEGAALVCGVVCFVSLNAFAGFIIGRLVTDSRSRRTESAASRRRLRTTGATLASVTGASWLAMLATFDDSYFRKAFWIEVVLFVICAAVAVAIGWRPKTATPATNGESGTARNPRGEVFWNALMWSGAVGAGFGAAFGALILPAYGAVFGGYAGILFGVITGLWSATALAYAVGDRREVTELWQCGALSGATTGLIAAIPTALFIRSSAGHGWIWCALFLITVSALAGLIVGWLVADPQVRRHEAHRRRVQRWRVGWLLGVLTAVSWLGIVRAFRLRLFESSSWQTAWWFHAILLLAICVVAAFIGWRSLRRK